MTHEHDSIVSKCSRNRCIHPPRCTLSPGTVHNDFHASAISLPHAAIFFLTAHVPHFDHHLAFLHLCTREAHTTRARTPAPISTAHIRSPLRPAARSNDFTATSGPLRQLTVHVEADCGHHVLLEHSRLQSAHADDGLSDKNVSEHMRALADAARTLSCSQHAIQLAALHRISSARRSTYVDHMHEARLAWGGACT